MALINCPNCGKEVSDKAKACPNCEHKLIENVDEKKESIIICDDCGFEIPLDNEACPNCGCPISTEGEANSNSTPQKVEITSVNLPTVKKSAKKYVIASVLVLLLIIVGTVFGIAIKNNQAAKLSAEYSENLKSTTSMILIGASEAETVANLIKSVWYNTIYEEWDSKTDKFTRSEG